MDYSPASMATSPDTAIDVASLPALLRAGWATYRTAVPAALAEAGYDDVPRNGSYLLSAMARIETPLAALIVGLGMSKQAAGALVDTLVVRGYLERSVDPDDRRRLIVALTPRGAAAVVVIRAAVQRVDEALEERIGADRLTAAREALAALAALGAEDA